MSTAYPLHWPVGFPRTKKQVPNSKMRTALPTAVRNLTDEMRRFSKDTEKEITNVVVSSNVTLMEDRPADPGVAVYFRWNGIDCCIPIDRYTLPEHNLQAASLIIEAERSKIRHGGLHIVAAGMRGYAALPPPKGPDGQLAAPWWQVLGFSNARAVTLPEVDARYRELVKTAHPDRGGDAARFNQITEAVRQAREELDQ